MKKLLFIFNPHTGDDTLALSMLDILCLMAKEGYEVTAHPTQARGDAYKTAKAQAEGYDLVVCCGGDGTLNETVHGLINIDNPPELGYIPGGTTNDFAASLDLPRGDMLRATERIMHPRDVFACDIGDMNGERIFDYVAAFGAFTDVSYSTPQRFKNLMGYLAYVFEAVQRLPNLQSVPVTVATENGRFEEEILIGMVSNSTSVGGFSFTGDVSLNDGLFEVLMVRKPHSLGDMAAISAALLRRDTESPYIISMHAREIMVESPDSVAWTLDGEFGGELKRAKIRVLPKAIRIRI